MGGHDPAASCEGYAARIIDNVVPEIHRSRIGRVRQVHEGVEERVVIDLEGQRVFVATIRETSRDAVCKDKVPVNINLFRVPNVRVVNAYVALVSLDRRADQVVADVDTAHPHAGEMVGFIPIQEDAGSVGPMHIVIFDDGINDEPFDDDTRTGSVGWVLPGIIDLVVSDKNIPNASVGVLIARIEAQSIP